MSKTKISQYDPSAANNTDVNGVNIAEGCAPSGINNAIREVMAALKRFETGSDGDSVTVGGNLVVSGSTTIANTATLGNVDINGGSIDGAVIGAASAAAGTFTTATATTGNITTVNATTVDTTNIEVTNIKAKDGTASASIADSTGVFTHATATVFPAGTNTAPSITTAGDTNTGIYFPAADTIAFTEGGAEAMRIDSSGNVGIGTSSPNAFVEIAKNQNSTTALRITNTDSTSNDNSRTSLQLANSGGVQAFLTYINAGSSVGAYVGTLQSGNLYFASGAGSTNMTLDSTGNLGLGVTPSTWSQGRAFEVFESGYGVWNGTASVYMLANAYFNSGFKYGGTGQASHYYQYQGAHVWSTAPSGTAGNAITFTQAMTLDASGNLGIGTTSPSHRLDVAGTSASAYLVSRINNLSSTGYARQLFEIGTAGANGAADISYAPGTFFAIGPSANDTTTPIVFRNNNATERARIDSSGNVLIGKTTATANGGDLQVSKGITFPATQSAQSDANTLDDYEEGTWTPTEIVSGFSTAIDSLSGTYTKIGRLVTVSMSVTLSSTGRPTSYSTFGGLPFSSSSSNSSAGSFGGANAGTGIQGGSTTIGASGTGITWYATNGTTNSTLWRGSASYIV